MQAIQLISAYIVMTRCSRHWFILKQFWMRSIVVVNFFSLSGRWLENSWIILSDLQICGVCGGGVCNTLQQQLCMLRRLNATWALIVIIISLWNVFVITTLRSTARAQTWFTTWNCCPSTRARTERAPYLRCRKFIVAWNKNAKHSSLINSQNRINNQL